MDLSVCEDQQDTVLGQAASRFHNVHHLGKDVIEVSGATETNAGQILPVELKDSLGAEDLWVLIVTVEREAVIDLVHSHEARNSSESIDREASVIVIDLKY